MFISNFDLFCFENKYKILSSSFFIRSKYLVKEKRMHEYITDDIEISSDDSDREHSDEKILIKEILMKKMLMKKIKYRMCLFLS